MCGEYTEISNCVKMRKNLSMVAVFDNKNGVIYLLLESPIIYIFSEQLETTPHHKYYDKSFYL